MQSELGIRDMYKKIGIIGFGNMGSAIAERIKSKYKVLVFDKDSSKVRQLADINIAKSITGLLKNTDALVLAVKPQDFDVVLDEIKAGTAKKLVISIAAGVTTGYIERRLGGVAVVRAMPNMPARIGKGITCLSRGRFASIGDIYFCKKLFGSLGKVLLITEPMMNAATAVSGSGPAYVYDIGYNNIPESRKKDFRGSFEEAAKTIGFNNAQAKILVSATINGAVAMLEAVNRTSSQLKKQIVSRGGTTEAALMVLRKGGSLKEAVAVALGRAEELSREE